MEEKLEQRVEELIDEKTGDEEDVDREQLKQEILEELDSRSEEERKSLVEKVSKGKVSRRDFLKTLGLGAGGLALSSSVAGGWSLWRPQKKGVSDINADTVDGKNASELGGKTIIRNLQGKPAIYSTEVITSYVDNGTYGKYDGSFTTRGSSYTYSKTFTSANLNGSAYAYLRAQAADVRIKIKRNGNTLTSGYTSVDDTSTNTVFGANPGDSITFSVHWSNGWQSSPTITWSYYFRDASATLSGLSPNTTRSPAWLKVGDFSGGSVTRSSFTVAGSVYTANSPLVGVLDSKSTITANLSFNGVTQTGNTVPLSIKEGKYLK